jgi:hypothetical protein
VKKSSYVDGVETTVVRALKRSKNAEKKEPVREED